MKKIIVNEKQKGFLFKNGKYIKLLGAGKYYLFGGREIEISDQDQPVTCNKCALETLLSDKNVAEKVALAEVADEQLALHYVNGQFSSVLRHGKYAFWSDVDRHEFKIVDISNPTVDESVPEYVFSKITQYYYTKSKVAEYQKARLYFKQKLERILSAGTYYF